MCRCLVGRLASVQTTAPVPDERSGSSLAPLISLLFTLAGVFPMRTPLLSSVYLSGSHLCRVSLSCETASLIIHQLFAVLPEISPSLFPQLAKASEVAALVYLWSFFVPTAHMGLIIKNYIQQSFNQWYAMVTAMCVWLSAFTWFLCLVVYSNMN